MPLITDQRPYGEDHFFACAIAKLGGQIIACDETGYTDPLAVEILQHAMAHLAVRRRRALIPQERPTTEQMAIAMLKALSVELTQAGQALDRAAFALKEHGALSAANGAKQASTRALRVASEAS